MDFNSRIVKTENEGELLFSRGPRGLCVHTNTSCKFRLEGHLLLGLGLILK